MKEYTARHYVRDDKGILHTPGEIFDAEYEDAAEERLLRLGAVIASGAYEEAAEPVQRVFEEQTVQDTAEADEADDVSGMIDVMEGITEAKTAKRGRKK